MKTFRITISPVEDLYDDVIEAENEDQAITNAALVYCKQNLQDFVDIDVEEIEEQTIETPYTKGEGI
jgi:hypothetical protein